MMFLVEILESDADPELMLDPLEQQTLVTPAIQCSKRSRGHDKWFHEYIAPKRLLVYSQIVVKLSFTVCTPNTKNLIPFICKLHLKLQSHPPLKPAGLCLAKPHYSPLLDLLFHLALANSWSRFPLMPPLKYPLYPTLSTKNSDQRFAERRFGEAIPGMQSHSQIIS
jgi:hypothetical protein